MNESYASLLAQVIPIIGLAQVFEMREIGRRAADPGPEQRRHRLGLLVFGTVLTFSAITLACGEFWALAAARGAPVPGFAERTIHGAIYAGLLITFVVPVVIWCRNLASQLVAQKVAEPRAARASGEPAAGSAGPATRPAIRAVPEPATAGSSRTALAGRTPAGGVEGAVVGGDELAATSAARLLTLPLAWRWALSAARSGALATAIVTPVLAVVLLALSFLQLSTDAVYRSGDQPRIFQHDASSCVSSTSGASCSDYTVLDAYEWTVGPAGIVTVFGDSDGTVPADPTRYHRVRGTVGLTAADCPGSRVGWQLTINGAVAGSGVLDQGRGSAAVDAAVPDQPPVLRLSAERLDRLACSPKLDLRKPAFYNPSRITLR